MTKNQGYERPYFRTRSIQIVTGKLSITNGAQLLTITRGKGDAGNVTINASDVVTVDGVGRDRSSISNP